MKKLVDIREEACLSQEKLAELTGLSRTLISAYELGTVDAPKFKSVKRLADFFSAYSDDIYKQFGRQPEEVFFQIVKSEKTFAEIKSILTKAGV
jgi:transcriptional regulator with XRE-family HTH domain